MINQQINIKVKKTKDIIKNNKKSQLMIIMKRTMEEKIKEAFTMMNNIMEMKELENNHLKIIIMLKLILVLLMRHLITQLQLQSLLNNHILSLNQITNKIIASKTRRNLIKNKNNQRKILINIKPMLIKLL